jgi:hypothetical protein
MLAVEREEAMSAFDINAIYATDAKTKYGCAKQAIAISKENPAALYPDLDVFIKLLDGPNRILKWTALQVLGNLAAVDDKKQIDKLLPKILANLSCGELITVNNAIQTLTEIAYYKPTQTRKIIDALLQIETNAFPTSECRNIAAGKVILALTSLIEHIRGNETALAFVKKQTANSRPATQKKAQVLLKRLIK